MPLLGASTKTFKSYGKRKVHTTNRSLAWDDSPPATTTAPRPTGAIPRSLNSSTSGSGSSSEGSPPPVRLTSRVKSIPAASRRKIKSSSEEDKENTLFVSQASPRKRIFATAKSRHTVQIFQSPVKPRTKGKSSTSSTESAEERQPLAPKGARRSVEMVEIVIGKTGRKQSPLHQHPKLPTEKEDSTREVSKARTTRGARSILESESEGSEHLESQGETSKRSLRSSRSRRSAEYQIEEESIAELSRHSTGSFAEKSQDEGAIDELGEDVAGLYLSDAVEEEEDELDSDDDPLQVLPTSSEQGFPSALSPLLVTVQQSAPYDFMSFIASPPAPFSSRPAPEEQVWTKIGEASYSEVFLREGLVVKIIPVASSAFCEAPDEDEETELPYTSEPESVQREIEISQMMGHVEGFVGFHGAYLVQGSYPPTLLDEWDRFRAEQPVSDVDEGEQIRPDVLPEDQVYAVLLLAHAGSDLETYALRSWTEAASVAFQVGSALAAGESVEFEHRDLHWGNILLRPSSSPPSRASVSVLATPPRARTSRPLFARLGAEASGVEATLIDFTLSRVLNEEGRVLHESFTDECIFEGEGDHQFEVYRMMKAAVEENEDGWSAFEARTNVMWLHYVLIKLLYNKKLRPPTVASPAGFASPARVVPSPFRSRTTRRTSTLLGSSTHHKAKARTLPTSGAVRKLEAEREAREKECYDLLVQLEDALRRSLGLEEGTGRETAARKRKGVAKSKGKKGRRAEKDGEGRFGSAEEVMSWWENGLE